MRMYFWPSGPFYSSSIEYGKIHSHYVGIGTHQTANVHTDKHTHRHIILVCALWAISRISAIDVVIGIVIVDVTGVAAALALTAPIQTAQCAHMVASLGGEKVS